MSVVYDLQTDTVRHFHDGVLMLELPIQEAKTGEFRDKNGHRYKLVNGVRVALGPNPNVKADVPRGKLHNKVSKKEAPPVQKPSKPSKSLSSFLSGTAKKVDSSYIQAAKYDHGNGILRISFHGSPGVWHRYSPITQEEAKDFFESESKGEWFWDHILVRGKGNKGKHQKEWEKETANA